MNDIKRGDKVKLNIPSARPIRVMSGEIFTSDDTFKFLGIYSCGMVRLSRVGDNAKLICEESRIIKADLYNGSIQ